MTGARQVTGGGRQVRVPPERLVRWLDGFRARHGEVTVARRYVGEPARGYDAVVAAASDAATASARIPYPPLPRGPDPDEELWQRLAAHAAAPRVVGLLLVRLGGFAVGVAEGEALVTAKAGSRPVHGRAAAGGWSQQRFARRREGQARVAMQAAAAAAAGVLLPQLDRLDALVVGGDPTARLSVLADRRLAPLLRLVSDDVLDVPDPRRAVLEAAVATARAVRVVVRDPPL